MGASVYVADGLARSEENLDWVDGHGGHCRESVKSSLHSLQSALYTILDIKNVDHRRVRHLLLLDDEDIPGMVPFRWAVTATDSDPAACLSCSPDCLSSGTTPCDISAHDTTGKDETRRRALQAESPLTRSLSPRFDLKHRSTTMKATQHLRTTTTTTTTTIFLLFLSSYTTVFAASPDSDSPTFEDTLHAELDFAYNLPREVSTGQELDSFFHTANFLGGASPQPIVFSGNPSRPFEVNGETFPSVYHATLLYLYRVPTDDVSSQPDFATAASRVCDNQKNACADTANDENKKTSFGVSDCDKQREQCMNSIESATETSFAAKTGPTLVVSNATHDIFCDV
ncbi:hypothetical protein QR685DRAFT_547750 [Neurospora intermedia]|uniref:Uncharacterized protein n=1 Tax=Neurospora intermedia TaxID=5142 RepID=A0ABR3D499_NEUIN